MLATLEFADSESVAVACQWTRQTLVDVTVVPVRLDRNVRRRLGGDEMSQTLPHWQRLVITILQ
jgi:hypothetical protein